MPNLNVDRPERKARIPRHDKGRDNQKYDSGYPDAREPQERDPGGNPIQPDAATFSGYIEPVDQFTITGGGLADASTQDEATVLATSIDPQYDGGDWASERAHADVQYDEQYGYAGLGNRAAPVFPTNTDDLIKALIEYARSSFKQAVLTRDVATDSAYNTITLQVGGDPYVIVGDNELTREIVVRSLAANTGNVLLGTPNDLTNAVGAGAFILEPGKDMPPTRTTKGLSAVLPAGAAAAQTITYIIGKYEK
jgi:hypothetical protein